MSEAVQVIRGARELLRDPNNWSPRGPGTAKRSTDDGCRCLLVAICHAARRAALPQQAWMEARDAVRAVMLGTAEPVRVTKEFPASIGEWNDTPGRTHADVMAALDKAEAYLCQSA